MQCRDSFFPLHQTWPYISSSRKGSSLVWEIQATKSCFPFQGIKHRSSWLHLMKIQIFICELNHFSGLHKKDLIFINKDMAFIALADSGPGKSQPQ